MWSSDQRLEQESFEERLNWLFVIVLFAAASLAGRLFYLQVIKGDVFAHIAEQNRIQMVLEKAPRGMIVDRNNALLVGNRPKLVVLFSPLKSSVSATAQIGLILSKILDQPRERLEQILSRAMRSQTMIRVADNITREKFMKLEEAKPDLPGIFIVVESRRNYPQGAFASHALGYLGEVNKDELNTVFVEGYRPGDTVGKMGVERIYDNVLRGTDGGFQVEVDAAGRSVQFLRKIPSRHGHTIALTLDKDLQRLAEDSLKASPSGKGSVVALDPRNGEVLVLASAPQYDPNLFLGALSKEVSRALFRSDEKPMFHRTLQGQYSPGSTFKIVTAVAALEKRAITPRTRFTCNGTFLLGKGEMERTFHCWEKKGHGSVDLLRAMAVSCDVYFYNVGLKTGVSSIAAVAEAFGLGSPTGIPLPGEKKGIVPNPTWKKMFRREAWFDGDTVNTAIGQGHVLVTPMQLANMIAIVANRGNVWQPQIVKRITAPDGKVVSEAVPEKLRTITLPPEMWDLLQRCLVEVVSSGTGAGCAVPGLVVAGKTGTVQNPHGEDHALFVAYAGRPNEEPSLALAVLVEHGLHGASAAVPIARKLIEAYFGVTQNPSLAKKVAPIEEGVTTP